MDEHREPNVMPGTDVGTSPQPGPIPPATCAVLAPAHPASEPLDGSDAEAFDRVRSFGPDLVVLDVMLPDVDGFELLARLRAAGEEMPVIFLTARDAAEDRVRGLTIGGDDYVVKPFSLEELIARVRTVLRRSGFAQRSSVLRCADLELDDDRHRVVRAGREIHLSPTEYKLLRYLLLNVGRVLSKS